MKHTPILSTIFFTALYAAAGTAYAQQPPDIVQSDKYGNTAMGTGALLNVDAPLVPKLGGDIGSSNTAVGEAALYSDTFGSDNTATGTGALRSNSFGNNNTALGTSALFFNLSSDNTATGASALFANTTGNSNTASGSNALAANTTGNSNSAVGFVSLGNNTTGSFNTALGAGAMLTNAGGSYNTASGNEALEQNVAGNYNTADGFNALYFNLASDNTASGARALYSNLTGHDNAALGAFAMYANSTGNLNTASGENALYFNVYGNSNAAFGHSALKYVTGGNNIGVGANAGYNLTSGSNNIDIGNEGIGGDNGIIRIGAPSTQIATYIAGINTTRITGAAVYVNANGQLGVLASSERYKTAIAPMGAGTEKLQELRPVSFHLKSDPKGAVQYGLIAEEVAKVYPELVIRDASGKIQGVRYDELAPMLLNEMQMQRSQMTQKIDSQAARIASLEQQLAGIQAALVDLQPKHQLVARR